jgi:hypothetical protein
VLVRCPVCGASATLEVLVSHDDAREALAALAGLGDPLVRSLIRYLSLHRPATRDLTFRRVARLLNELLPDLKAQRITRNGQRVEAPADAWIWAIDAMLVARDEGRLRLPLKGHGYLYELLSCYQPHATRGGANVPAHPDTSRPSPAGSRVASAIDALQHRVGVNPQPEEDHHD